MNNFFAPALNIFGEPAPVLIGNRGAGAGEVMGSRNDGWGNEGSREWVKENTLESFYLGLQCGIQWFKIEVCLSSDGKLILSNERTLPSGKMIFESSSLELRHMGYSTLDEVFEVIPPEIGFIVEIKYIFADINGAGSSEITAKALIKEKLLRPERPLMVYSMEASSSLVMKRLLAEHEIGLGFSAEGSDIVALILSAKRFGLKFIFAQVKSLLSVAVNKNFNPTTLKEILEEVHLDEIKVVVLEPDIFETKELMRCGIDAFCVNNIPAMSSEFHLKPIKV